MKIGFIDVNNARCNALKRINTPEGRYSFLIKGEIEAANMLDIGKPRDKYYLPKMNGVVVYDSDSRKKKFRSRESAIKEGRRIRDAIEKGKLS